MAYRDLNEQHPKIKQPRKVKDRLRSHQLTCVAAMKELEKNRYIIIDPTQDSDFVKDLQYMLARRTLISDSLMTLRTNTAILADKVGSGKTHIIYSLLACTKRPISDDYVLCGQNHISINVMNDKQAVRTNLIVLPHNIVNQWVEVSERTKLSTIVFSMESDFDILFDSEELPDGHEDTKRDKSFYNNYNSVTGVIYRKYRNKVTKKTLVKERIDDILENTRIILLNIKRYKTFSEYFENIYWSRLIIDEIVSIGLPGGFNEIGSFNWLITATPRSIRSGSCGRYLSSVFGHISAILPYFIVKNNDEYVEKSQTLPDPDVYMITSKLPASMDRVKDLIPPDILKMINAGDVSGATKALNCDIDTDENIFEVLTNTTKTELHNKKNELKFVSRTRVVGKQEIEKKQKKMAALQMAIDSLKYKIDTIKERIELAKTEICFICADTFKAPTIMECCNNVFCLECLLQALRDGNHKCPYCRSVVTNKKYHVIKYEAKKNKKREKKKKKKKEDVDTDTGVIFKECEKTKVLKHLLKYVSTNHKSPRIIIFSDYNSTFDSLIKIFADLDLQYAKLAGTPATINKTVTRFELGEINIIMTESKNYGSGMNLQCADYIILYHRMGDDLETQVIGRAQRYGRKDKLKIFYLVNENESKNTNVTQDVIHIHNQNALSYISHPNDYFEAAYGSDSDNDDVDDDDVVDEDEEEVEDSDSDDDDDSEEEMKNETPESSESSELSDIELMIDGDDQSDTSSD